MKNLIPWESSCFSISPEFFVVWLIYSDEELLAAKCNRLAVNQTFYGRRFTGCLPFFRVGQGGVLERQEASAEEKLLMGFWYRIVLSDPKLSSPVNFSNSQAEENFFIFKAIQTPG